MRLGHPRGVKAIHRPDKDSGNRRCGSYPLRITAKAGAPSPAILVLVQLCIDLRYGRIERLHVRRGEPVFAPAPEAVRTVKFGGPAENAPPTLAQILSKPQTQALLRELACVESGCILRLEVRDSQPCFMEIAIQAAEASTRA
jgi:hypothetical protein